jgi:flagellar biogenesis protein FliO
MKPTLTRAAVLSLPFWAISSALAQTTNAASSPLTESALPDPIPSLFRVFGALALVIGVFLGGVWMVRNWQRVGGQAGRQAKLTVLETRSLGNRQAIYVVGYERERFLIASSPGGVNLLSHLATAAEGEPVGGTGATPAPSFAQALTQVLKNK